MDWTVYLKQLQTVLREFNTNVVILEPILIYLLCNGLKLFIFTQVNQHGQRKDT